MFDEEVAWLEPGVLSNEAKEGRYPLLFVNLDKRQFYDMEKAGLLDSSSNGPLDLVDRVMVRCPLKCPSRTAFDNKMVKNLLTISRLGTCKLAQLPLELHELFFEPLGYMDALCFAYTCKHFWVVGHRRLVELVKKSMGTWAGDRVFYLPGAPNIIPPALSPPDFTFSESERHPNFRTYLKTHFTEELPSPLLDYGHLITTHSRQMSACCDEVARLDPQHSPELAKWSRQANFFAPQRKPPTSSTGSSNAWIVRNLTTSEYVVLKNDGEHRTKLDILDVFVRQSIWFGPNGPGGGWVGHQIDISTQSEIQTDVNSEWKDVSRVVGW